MKNSFIVQFAVHLLILQIGLTGFPASVVAFIASYFLGKFLDYGILEVDLSMDALREALKEDEWKASAQKAYDHATARVYTEAEKQKIRDEYLSALDKYTYIGPERVPDSPDSKRQDVH